jgi:hypothetical protein
MTQTKPSLHTCFSPALLNLYDLKDSVVVIIDVFRATSTIAAALHNGARFIVPVDTVPKAIELSEQLNGIAAGERDGKIADGLQHGNSPLEYHPDFIKDRILVLTTTNGTRLLHMALEREADTIITGSFPNLLLDAANKTLLAGYDEAPYTWELWARNAGTTADFKTLNRIRFSEMGSPEMVPEGEAYPDAPMSDAKETYKVNKYGSMFTISWETVVNDDLDAISRIPAMQGAACRRQQNQAVYGVLTANAAMADGGGSLAVAAAAAAGALLPPFLLSKLTGEIRIADAAAGAASSIRRRRGRGSGCCEGCLQGRLRGQLRTGRRCPAAAASFADAAFSALLLSFLIGFFFAIALGIILPY